MLPVIPLLILLLFNGVNPHSGASRVPYAPETLQVRLRAQEQWLIDAIQEQLSQQTAEKPSLTADRTTCEPKTAAQPQGRLQEGFFRSSRNRDGPSA
jgi:hypothetical protein